MGSARSGGSRILRGLKIDSTEFRWETHATPEELDTTLGPVEAGAIGATSWELEGTTSNGARIFVAPAPARSGATWHVHHEQPESDQIVVPARSRRRSAVSRRPRAALACISAVRRWRSALLRCWRARSGLRSCDACLSALSAWTNSAAASASALRAHCSIRCASRASSTNRGATRVGSGHEPFVAARRSGGSVRQRRRSLKQSCVGRATTWLNVAQRGGRTRSISYRGS